MLAIASGAMLLPFSVGAANNTIVVDQAAAVNLAEALMEEILAKPFYDPNSTTRLGKESGETRTTMDNIDDYHGYAETAGHMTNAAGATITDPSLSLYYRTVTVAYVTWPGQDTSGSGVTAARVIVEVKANGQTIYKLTRLVGRRNELPVNGGVLL
ncbi:MAG: hypothetical protein PHU85_07945 [Phycisphaerae bacterium]|nr:hypothetical protein [Phycisphaerae bacterium]